MDLGALIWNSCERGYYRLTKALIKRGAPVNHAVDLRECELRYCILEPIVAAASSGNVDIVRLLLDHGANIQGETYFPEADYTYLGGTALHAAVANEHSHVVAFLLEQGADVHAGDGGEGLTPLQRTHDLSILKLLLEYGADPNVMVLADYWGDCIPLLASVATVSE